MPGRIPGANESIPVSGRGSITVRKRIRYRTCHERPLACELCIGPKICVWDDTRGQRGRGTLAVASSLALAMSLGRSSALL